MGRNRGRAHIDGKAEYLVMEAGPDRDELLAAAGDARIDRAGDLPFAFFQGGLEFAMTARLQVRSRTSHCSPSAR